MGFNQPFDLYYWFVNVFAGSMEMFLAIAFLVIAAMSGMFRMPTIITGIMFSLFLIFISASTGNLVIVALMLIGLIIGWIFARTMK